MQLHDLLADLAGFDGVGVLELRGAPGSIDGPMTPVEITAVVHDSREAGPGALFCCIPGGTTDGHLHAPAAVSAGAVALLVEEWLALDVPQARVRSVRAVLGPLAARFHGEPSFAMRVLGVTGTNGKTTTTYLLESIARAAGDIAGVIGTVGARVGDRVLPNEHTTPEATELQVVLAAMRDEGVDTVAMEVSSHALDQHRVDATNFAATCFTNLSHDHLDYHESVDSYFEAKARLFSPVFTRRAAIHVGDPHGERLARRAAAKDLVVSRFAVDDTGAHVTARRVELSADGTAFDLVACGGTPLPVRMSLLGSFNVVNALGAASTALLAGFDLESIVAGLERPIVVPGRMERVDAGQEFTVLVDYAHTPAALDAALGAARDLVGSDGRLIAVFGCGGDRDRTKRPLMGEIAARRADRAYVTNDNPRSEDPAAIIEEILAGVPADSGIEPIPDRRAAIGAAIAAARAGDVVVVAGKGHERGQIVGARTEPFDDRVVVREVLETLGVITTAAEIAHHARGVVVGAADAVVTSWAFDSRAVDAGACFVALHGERDGHDFVADAFAAGATVALISTALPGVSVPPGAAMVQVDDVLQRLQDLARAARTARSDLRVVGVTGSTGKTSTKDLLAAALEGVGCYASPASYNNEFGLPITLLNAPVDVNIVVAELGERFPGDVAALCAIAKPSVGVVTNVGLAHAEHLGGVEGAAKAMGELLESLPADGLAVLNADDEWTPTLVAAARADLQVATVGTAVGADFRVEAVELDAQLHPSFSFAGRRVTVPLHGEHQVMNAALALAVAQRGFGVDLDVAARALASVRPARWRLEMEISSSGVTVLNDAYNANPASMDAALCALAGVPTTGRRIAVLGDMRELGIHTDEAHAAAGRRAAELGVDVIVGVGVGGRAIADAAGAGPEVSTAADAAAALGVVTALVGPGDTVLVKASRAVGLEIVAANLLGAAS